MSADVSADAPNWVPMGVHAAQSADLHGDELVATRPEQMMPISERLLARRPPFPDLWYGVSGVGYNEVHTSSLIRVSHLAFGVRSLQSLALIGFWLAYLDFMIFIIIRVR